MADEQTKINADYDEHQQKLRDEPLPYTGTIQVVQPSAEKFYVRVLASNGKVLMHSEDYEGHHTPAEVVENLIHAVSNPKVLMNDADVTPPRNAAVGPVNNDETTGKFPDNRSEPMPQARNADDPEPPVG